MRNTIRLVEVYKHPEFALYTTKETPADDLVKYPYHFSSQIIAWATFFNLGEYLKEIDPGLASFCKERSTEIKEAIMEKMVAVHPKLEKELYVYTTDLAGNYEFTQDANDLPTMLLPYLGFCDRNDRV